MLKYLIALTATFVGMTAMASVKPVTGTIVDVVVGEISVGLGDACIVGVETKNQKLIALVTDFDHCVEYGFDSSFVGKEITVAAASLTLVEDAETIRLLKDFSSEPFYIYADFDGIVKGLK